MQGGRLRVVLASEYPQARDFLREVVEEESGAVIVGQSENASAALALSRNLRPDIAIIDCYLPHAVGLDGVPLSRMGGLDTAQTISEEIPNIRVILLNNLNTGILPDHGLSSDVAAGFSTEVMGADTPFTLLDLCHDVVQPNALVFADVEVKPRASVGWKITNLSTADVVFNGLGILCIFGLIWVLAVITETRILLAFPGAAVLGLGIGFLIKRLKQPKIKK